MTYWGSVVISSAWSVFIVFEGVAPQVYKNHRFLRSDVYA